MTKQYRKYGRMWSVKKADCGSYYIGAPRRGYPDAVLNRLGTSKEKSEMETILQRWAKKNGAVEVVPKGAMTQGKLV